MSKQLFTSALIAYSAHAASLSATAASHAENYHARPKWEYKVCNPGLSVRMYSLPDGATSLPLDDEEQFHLEGVSFLDAWGAKRIGWDIGEGSLRGHNDNFVLEYTGYIMIPETGDWTFGTKSDDGSRLWIDDRSNLVVNNDGLHGAKEVTGTTNLKAGPHRIFLNYFEKDWGAMMELYMGGPNFEY